MLQSVLPLNNVQICDEFWSKYIKLVHNVVIPYQWEAINDRVSDAEPSHAIKNFRIAAGLEDGDFYGLVFQDTDLAKWLEAVAYRLQTHSDKELERTADEAIELIEKAQQPDGYLNTYFTVKEPGKRWTNLRECHELYTAGHMFEAAAAYYKATGKRRFLDNMCRFADYIDSVFGSESFKMRGYDGHQEIELALVKLYEVTGEDRYLRLSKYFLDERGKEPYFFDLESEKRGNTVHFEGSVMYNRKYAQTHLPVREQAAAEGHAVRAVYMLSGMADVAGLTGDEELLDSCRRLWANIVTKRMYVTGGIGSIARGEAFSFDYDLPNDMIYAETCASIGLIFFAHRMLKLEPKGSYADVLERSLYNTVLAGMSQDGKSFFYVNPLEVLPEACEKNENYAHVKPVRQKWFGCACCPTNVARILSSIGQYIYTVSDDTIYTHLYIGGESSITLQKANVTIKQSTNYPWDGKITLEISSEKEKEFAVALRIPGWCSSVTLSCNGVAVENSASDGYILIRREWNGTNTIDLALDMPVVLMQASPFVRADSGKIAIQRGPLVYCVEEQDNGGNLSALSLSINTAFQTEFDEKLLGGAVVIKAEGYRDDAENWEGRLYGKANLKKDAVAIKAIPYFLWGNRTPGEMAVWIRYAQ